MIRALSFLVLIASLGCAGTFDLLYGDRFTRRSDESAPTGETVERYEYRTSEVGEALECTLTERSIERRRAVIKTYRRRGGLGPNLYGGAIAADAVFGGLAGGAMLALCLNDHLSCWHMLWASPFALDMLYGAVRLAMARPPVLIQKERSEDWAAVGDVPIAEVPTQCTEVSAVRLGISQGSSNASASGEGDELQSFAPGFVDVPLGTEHLLSFGKEVLETWVEHPTFDLWVVDAQGAARRIEGINRCKAIVHHRNAIPVTERSAALQAACPPEPQPAAQ